MNAVHTRVMQQPHWYCLFLAVEPTLQCQGIGSALLRYIQALAQVAKVPVYLESDVPENVAYYRQHGFVVVECWRGGFAGIRRHEVRMRGRVVRLGSLPVSTQLRRGR
jgi:GNAT superfamily N-acetyltransferase